MVQRVPAEEAGDAWGLMPKVAESAGVDHFGGVDEVTDDLIVRVGGGHVRASRLSALVGVSGVNRSSQPVKIINQLVCQFENF